MFPIEISHDSQVQIPDVKIHLLPVKIARNGKANVSKFFLPEVDKDTLLKGEPTLKVNFRGRQFRGASQAVPSGYKGYVFREDEQDESDSKTSSKQWTVTGQFGQFTYWHREDAPTEGDAVQHWLSWFDLAKAVHGPLDAETLYQPCTYTTNTAPPQKGEASEAEGALKRKPSDESAVESPEKQLKKQKTDST